MRQIPVEGNFGRTNNNNGGGGSSGGGGVDTDKLMNYGIGVGIYLGLPLVFGILTFLCCICFFLCKCLCMCCKCCDPKPEGGSEPSRVLALLYLFSPRVSCFVRQATPSRSASFRSTFCSDSPPSLCKRASAASLIALLLFLTTTDVVWPCVVVCCVASISIGTIYGLVSNETLHNALVDDNKGIATVGLRLVGDANCKLHSTSCGSGSGCLLG